MQIRGKCEILMQSMLEIINGPVNLEGISEAARKRITRAQRHGVATLCVPVDVEIRGGFYIQVTGRDNLRLWDPIGEFRFSIFRSVPGGFISESVVRYNLTGDGRMRRLVPSLSGYLNEGEVNEVEPMRVHPKLIGEGNQSLSIRHAWGVYVTEQGVQAKISWYEESQVRGVDARVNQAINPQTGQEEAILCFIAVPEPGQWRGVERSGDKFPGADRSRMVINSPDNPIPFLQPVDVVF